MKEVAANETVTHLISKKATHRPLVKYPFAQMWPIEYHHIPFLRRRTDRK